MFNYCPPSSTCRAPWRVSRATAGGDQTFGMLFLRLSAELVERAGNDGADSVRWPARIPSVLAVAAVDWEGAPTSWTNFGTEVSVAAPGIFIETTVPGGKYDYFGGTSASAPIVTALAAMISSEHPDWSSAQVSSRIEVTAHPARLAGRPDVVGRFGAGVASFGDAL